MSLRTTLARRGALGGLAERRRALQVALGLVWLLDAALQFQPFMFSRSFVTQIIQPSAAGNPQVLAHSVAWASQVMLHHIAVYNGIFAAIQLLIAVGLFFRRTVKITLAASIVWALFVWWFGESLGGIFGGASPLNGLPGVVLYALIAALLWPKDRPGGRKWTSPATSGPLGSALPKVIWLTLWGGFAYFLLLPDNRAPDGVSQTFAFTVGQPGWLTSIMNDMSRLSGARGTEISVALAVLCSPGRLRRLLCADAAPRTPGRHRARVALLARPGARRHPDRQGNRPQYRAPAGSARPPATGLS